MLKSDSISGPLLTEKPMEPNISIILYILWLIGWIFPELKSLGGKDVSIFSFSNFCLRILFSILLFLLFNCNSKKDLKILVKDSQTPMGLNAQGLKEMSKRGVYKSLINALNGIHKRLNK